MSNTTEGRNGGITPEIKQALAPHLIQMPVPLRAALDLPFEPADVKRGETRGDGFTPTWVEPNTVIRRLNDCFGGTWSDKIVSHEFIWNASQVIAIVRITGEFYVHEPDGSYAQIKKSHDGVGAKALTIVNGQLIDPANDLKAAVADGLKTAARKFGIGMQLWDATPKLTPAAQQQVVEQQQQQPVQHAAQFQIDGITNYFETRCKIARNEWMTGLGIIDTLQITPDFAQYVLSGSHPYVLHVQTQTGQFINPGLRATAAR